LLFFAFSILVLYFMRMKKKLTTILQYIFFLALGIFLVWWSVKDIDDEKWSQIRGSLRNARFILIGPVFLILLGSHFVRALRWRLLMEPLGYRPAILNTFFAVLIGYLTNQAVPRLGEVLKCTVLARYEKIPADKLVGTIILERIIDAVTLLMIFGITLLIQPGLYSQLLESVFTKSGDDPGKGTPAYVILLIVAGSVVVLVVAWMVFRKKTFADLGRIFRNIGGRVWQGLTAIQHLRKRGRFIVLTILLWCLYLSGGYVGFYALQETEQYGVKEAFTVLSAGSIGMIIPTPGGIGAYAYLIERTMQLYGLKQSIAVAFGWLLWLSQTVVILIGGLVSFILLPWYNKKIRALQPAPAGEAGLGSPSS
jgi:glycosyltransferase 2 family protein